MPPAFAAMQRLGFARPWNPRSALCVLLEGCGSTELRSMPEEKTAVLCPSCKNRMSISRIAQGMSEDARKMNYHCAMCDIEIRQSAAQRPHASVKATAGIRNPRFAA